MFRAYYVRYDSKEECYEESYIVRFKDNGKTYYFDPADTPIKPGDLLSSRRPGAWSAAKWCRA